MIASCVIYACIVIDLTNCLASYIFNPTSYRSIDKIIDNQAKVLSILLDIQ
jgi:hypothetical protein